MGRDRHRTDSTAGTAAGARRRRRSRPPYPHPGHAGHRAVFDQAAFRGWRYANQALDEARRFSRPEELGIAVSAYILSATVLDQVQQIRAVITEMLQGDRAKLTPVAETIVRANLLTERIRSGELARFDAEFPQVWQLATDVLHSPELQEQLYATQACRHLAAGDTERGNDISQVVFRTLQDPASPWREPQRIVVDNCMMLITGTLADHADDLAARAAQPDHPSVPHLAAPAAALGFTLRGDLEQARQIASRWFAPPPWSWARPQAIAFWAHVAAALGLPDPSWLYEQLAPHTGELAIVGVAGDCGGAVDSLMAGLAWRLGRPDEAAALAQAGLALENRVGSQIWINRTEDLIGRITAEPGSPTASLPR